MDVYGLIEDIHLVELQRADAAAREVQHAISRQQGIVLTARAECRQSLEVSDPMLLNLAEVVHKTSNTNLHLLEPIRQEREGLRDDASRKHAASRIKRKQMERLVSEEEEQIKIKDGRKLQAQSDERFLGRRLWKGIHSKSSSGVNLR